MAISRERKLEPNLAQPAVDQLWHADSAMFRPVHGRGASPGPQAAAPLANDDAYTTNDTTTITGNLLTNDTPGDVPLAIIAVNGSALAVDHEIILPSGARLRVNSDGSFTYNPNGAFDTVPATNNLFTYTVTGGDTATVTITVEDPPNPNIGTDNPETLTGTPGDDVLDARGGDDTVYGLGGNDSIDGGTGADSLIGGTGNDTYKVDNAGDTVTEADGEGYDIIVASVNYTLAAGVYAEELVTLPTRMTPITLTGNDLDNIIRGGLGADILIGAGGNDLLEGGLGAADSLRGGTGDDSYLVFGSDTIVELDGEGYDTVYVIEGGAAGQYSYALNAGAHVELIVPLLGTNTPMFGSFSGNEFDNEIHGTPGTDTIRGNGGNDTMIGFGGNDIYYVADAGDAVVEAQNGGIDRILTSIDYQLTDTDNIENLFADAAGVSLGGNNLDNLIIGAAGSNIILGGAGNDILNGGADNDSLYGDAGNDSLDGGTGVDLMDGGIGNDFYVVDNINDVVIEAAEAGQNPFSGDTILTSVNYTLAANQHIETLQSAGSAHILTGNDLAQRILGSSGTDMLFGLGGDDILVGGGGTDTTDGGFGDDSHYVDNGLDIVIERSGEGRDVIYAAASYALRTGVSVEVLSTESYASTAAIDLTGNELVQEIYGNAGANIFRGGGGADYMAGFGGDDTYYISDGQERIVEAVGEGRDIIYSDLSYALAAGLSIEVLSTTSIAGTGAMNLQGNELAQEIYGNNGKNVLIGGGGTDYILGFGGDDIYYVISGTEILLENANQGRDVVYTPMSYALAAGTSIEVLSTTSIAGTQALNLQGNELAQEIYGNNGNNVLIGGGGTDYMLGFGGDDTYYIISGTEVLIESAGQGSDVVYAGMSYTLSAEASIELLSTTSIAGTGAINLTGNELNNQLWGNNGANTLNGGAGTDSLIGFGGNDTFAFTTTLSSNNVDVIFDFAAGDRIALHHAVFTGLAPGALPPGAFVTGSAAGDADDRIIYDQASGQLFFDADGNGVGTAVLFATLQGAPTLAASDFVVI